MERKRQKQSPEPSVDAIKSPDLSGGDYRRKATATALCAAALAGVAAGVAVFNPGGLRDKADEFIRGEKLPELSSESVTVCSPTPEEAMKIPFDAEGAVAWMVEREDGETVEFIDKFTDDDGDGTVDRLPRASVSAAFAVPLICEAADATEPLTARDKNGVLMLRVNQSDLEIRLSAYNSSENNPTNIEAVRFEKRDRLADGSIEELKGLQDDPEAQGYVISEFMEAAAYKLADENNNVVSDIEAAYQNYMRESLTARMSEIAPEYEEVEVSFRGSFDVVAPGDLISQVEIPERLLEVHSSEAEGKMYIGTEKQDEEA